MGSLATVFVALLAADMRAAPAQELPALPVGAVVGAAAAAETGVEAAASEVAGVRVAAAEPRWRPERHTSGGLSLDGSLRRRLEEDERREATAVDEQNDALLRRLYRDALAIPDGPPPFDSDAELETPSTTFLHAVAPERREIATVERRGFDRWAAREVQREWRRKFRADLENQLEARKRTWASDVDAYTEHAERQIDGDWAARWKAPFPCYWEGHPSARPAEHVVVGEDIEILRIGRLTLGNDLEVRYDFRSFLSANRPASVAEDQARHRSRPSHADQYATSAPRGNVYTSDLYTVDTNVRLGAGLNAYETGFVRSVGTRVDLTFIHPYDRRSFVRFELSWDYDTAAAENAFGAALVLLRY